MVKRSVVHQQTFRESKHREAGTRQDQTLHGRTRGRKVDTAMEWTRDPQVKSVTVDCK